MKKQGPKIPNFLAKPLVFFFYFLCVNVLLAYGQLSLESKLWLGLFGFALPFGWVLLSAPSQPARSVAWKEEWVPPARPWLWILAVAAGIFLHCFKLTSYLHWPLLDEGVDSYFAMRLDEKWSWYPFFDFNQMPPLYIWLLALSFKVFQPSFLGIWVVPACLSLGTLFLGYAACRIFFSRPFSFLYFCLAVVSFWLLYFGRISHQAILLVFWELLCFFVLGKFWTASTGRGRKGFLAILGLLLGAGFYTYQAWPFVLVPILAALYWKTHLSKDRKPSAFYVALALCFLAASPLVAAALSRGYGTYLRDRFAFHGQMDWPRQVQSTLSCLTAFFWDNGERGFFYGPSWGGFLNPVAAALFFLGLSRVWSFRSAPFSRWILFSMLFLLTPAFLTNTLTEMREAGIFPFLILLCLFGMQTLLKEVPRNWRGSWIAALVLVSASLDLFHLHLSRDFLNGYWNGQKCRPYWQTYQVLEKMALERGPGFFLGDLSNACAYSKSFGNIRDQTLTVTTYSFNAARNPRLAGGGAHWLALLVDSNDGPFLARRFPEGRGFSIDGGNAPGSGFLLWVLPPTPQNQDVFRRWVEADRAFRRVTETAMDLPEKQPRGRILQLLPQLYPSFQGDPLLESIFWGVVYANHNWEALYGDQNRPLHFRGALEAVQNALRRGYPTAYFCNEWGGLEVVQKNYPAARRAFQRAMGCGVNDTSASENLEALNRLAPPRPSN